MPETFLGDHFILLGPVHYVVQEASKCSISFPLDYGNFGLYGIVEASSSGGSSSFPLLQSSWVSALICLGVLLPLISCVEFVPSAMEVEALDS